MQNDINGRIYIGDTIEKKHLLCKKTIIKDNIKITGVIGCLFVPCVHKKNGSYTRAEIFTEREVFITSNNYVIDAFIRLIFAVKDVEERKKVTVELEKNEDGEWKTAYS